MIEVVPGDRVLLLSIPPVSELRDLATRVPDAVLVGLADPEEVYEARRVLRDFSNVMITPAGPGDGIPWRDGFFSVVYAPALEQPTPEILRVLAPGGRIHLAGDVSR